MARRHARYLMLLLGCVTSPAKLILPQFGLANSVFAVQHLSRDKG
jgi:hypothetical protein